ncbi:MAG TPA: hypothetical protein VIS07_15830 [Candidatus Binatia bacterium]
MEAQPRAPRRGNREKELFALRAKQVKDLFQRMESLSQAINKEASSTLITTQRSISAKNLGGIEVPDGARLVLKFLDRRLEVVVNPLQSVGGRPVPIGGLASASVIQYDASDPTGADWFDVTLREDGWHRKLHDNETGPPALADKDLRKLIEWLIS